MTQLRLTFPGAWLRSAWCTSTRAPQLSDVCISDTTKISASLLSPSGKTELATTLTNLVQRADRPHLLNSRPGFVNDRLPSAPSQHHGAT